MMGNLFFESSLIIFIYYYIIVRFWFIQSTDGWVDTQLAVILTNQNWTKIIFFFTNGILFH